VKNTNLLLEKPAALGASGQERSPEYGELKRRFGWEFNGMRLHELYFGNLGGKASLPPDGALAAAARPVGVRHTRRRAAAWAGRRTGCKNPEVCARRRR
jgi:hypothetical protein